MHSCVQFTKKNTNTIFASEKLEILDKLVDAVVNMTINIVGYELSAATVSDAKFEFVSNPKILLTSAMELFTKKC